MALGCQLPPQATQSNSTWQLEHLRIGLTFACNLRCKYCFNQQNNTVNKKEILSKEVKSCINSALPLGLKTVSLTGGEPLLRLTQVFEILSYAKKNSLQIGLLTNGTLMTDQVADKLKKVGIDWVRISLDSPHQKINAIGRDEEYFPNVLRTIKELRKRDINVILRPTILRENIDYFEDLINFAKEYNIDKIEARPFIPLIDNQLNNRFRFSYGEHSSITKKLLHLQKKHSTDTNVHLTEGWYSFLFDGTPPKEIKQSTHGRTFGYVNPYGDVLTCPGNTQNLGNIRQNNIAEIWQYSSILNQIRNRKTHSLCNGCDYAGHCKPCPTALLNTTGSLDGPPTDCPKIMAAL
jgi:AdoMet-dependent heme synthase